MKKPKVTTPTPLAALSSLSPAVRAIVDALVDEYRVRDAGGLQVLLSGAVSLDFALRCERQIAKDGPLLTDRWGQQKAHPLIAAARDSRAAWQVALKSLNLAIGDPPTPGRPMED